MRYVVSPVSAMTYAREAAGEYLFIGGVWDGRRTDTPLCLQVEVPVVVGQRPEGGLAVTRNRYRPVVLQWHGEPLIVYALEGMSDADVFVRLLKGYRAIPDVEDAVAS